MYALATKFGRPPSSWFGELDPIAALSVDLRCLTLGAEEEERAHRRAMARARRR